MTQATPRIIAGAPGGINADGINVPGSAKAVACGTIIAVASGKGGVGKTWFAITLAHALARRGRRVLLLDGDLGLANVDIQLGLTPIHDLGAVVAGQASIAEVAQRHPDGGFDIVAWIIPLTLFVGAVFGTALLVRMWSVRRRVAAGPAGLHAEIPMDNSLREKIRRETEW